MGFIRFVPASTAGSGYWLYAFPEIQAEVPALFAAAGTVTVHQVHDSTWEFTVTCAFHNPIQIQTHTTMPTPNAFHLKQQGDTVFAFCTSFPNWSVQLLMPVRTGQKMVQFLLGYDVYIWQTDFPNGKTVTIADLRASYTALATAMTKPWEIL